MVSLFGSFYCLASRVPNQPFLPLPPQPLQCKALGNKALQAGDFITAIDHYTAAIDKDGSNHVYYSNRSAAHLSSNQLEKALEDGEACVGLKPDWPKGWARKASALWKMGRMNDAQKCYEDGIKAAGEDKSLVEGLAKLVEAKNAPPRPTGGANPMAGLFGPQVSCCYLESGAFV